MKTRVNYGAKIFYGTLLNVIYDCAKFHEVSPTGFSKKFDQISKKNKFFTNNFFLNTIPRPNFVTNDSNFLLYN